MSWAVRDELSTVGELALMGATVAAAFVALTITERRLVRRGRDLSAVYAASYEAGSVAAALTVGFAVAAQVAGLLRAESVISEPQFLPVVGAVGVVLAVLGYTFLRRSAVAASRRPT